MGPRVDRAAVPAARLPGPGLISNFDGDRITAAFGYGWQPASDVIQGGRSVATVKLASGGASGSAGSLHVEGEIAQSANAWAGATFWPAHEMMLLTDLSGATRLSFWAKGDGRTYFVGTGSGSPSGLRRATAGTFVAGRDWREHTFDLSDQGVDIQRVLWVGFYTGPTPGRFAFQIDEVRLR